MKIEQKTLELQNVHGAKALAAQEPGQMLKLSDLYYKTDSFTWVLPRVLAGFFISKKN